MSKPGVGVCALLTCPILCTPDNGRYHSALLDAPPLGRASDERTMETLFTGRLQVQQAGKEIKEGPAHLWCGCDDHFPRDRR
jgi:hypothetical protein